VKGRGRTAQSGNKSFYALPIPSISAFATVSPKTNNKFAVAEARLTRVSQTGSSPPLGPMERFSKGHEQRPSLGSFAVILHNPSVTIYYVFAS